MSDTCDLLVKLFHVRVLQRGCGLEDVARPTQASNHSNSTPDLLSQTLTMVLGLFARKPAAGDEAPTSPELRTNGPLRDSRLPTPTPSTVSIPASVGQSSPLRFPSSLRALFGGSTSNLVIPGDSDVCSHADGDGSARAGSPALPPPVTPSPPPTTVDSKVLYELMLTIPPKTLHAYALAHLRPHTPQPTVLTDAPESHTPPPSPETISKLSRFFSTLAPPPLLHCVRCHDDFYAIENEEKDRACRVPHDDESALVSRIPGGNYETLWGCCGQISAGDGGQGPPDGWCYEGRHTVSSLVFSVPLSDHLCRWT